MEKVKQFLDGIPKGERADWARRHEMDPVRVSQIAGGHKGCGLDYARKILAGAKELGAELTLDDFFEVAPAQQDSEARAAE